MADKAIAYAERESDLARMTIFQKSDGRMVARLRRPEDSLEPSHREGVYNDLWRHVGSGGHYLRHDEVYDEDAGQACYDYSSYETGRLWLRSVREWHENVRGGPRFVPVATL